MLKKTLIATATAGLIAAGAPPVGTATTASAAGVYFGPARAGAWRHRRPRPGSSAAAPVCQPVFKTVKWCDRWGKPHFKKSPSASAAGGPTGRIGI